VEGTAELVVRAGQIAAFTFASDEESGAWRRRQLDIHFDVQNAALAATPRLSGPMARGSGLKPGTDPAGPPDPRLVSGLAAALVVGLLVRGWRRRTRAG
jgi:hypothetical protein